jgi:uncharacterized protein (TIGR00730 family)
MNDPVRDRHPEDLFERGSGTVEEGYFLSGRNRRRSELARTLRIAWEFIRGFRTLHFVGPCVTVFGSARFEEDHRYYQLARAVGSRLAKAGFTVMTGGGPGIMEAANRGAREAGGRSIGCSIQIPDEQVGNPYLDLMVEFHYFFVRKVMLVKYSYAFIVLPGGFGTMDEIFETATLIQTGKMDDFPIVIMGSDYWRPLLRLLEEKMIPEGTIDAEDLSQLVLTDSAEEAVSLVLRSARSKFGLEWEPRPSWILGERKGA